MENKTDTQSKEVDQLQDNEAAGLLMLFQRQSLPQPQSSQSPTETDTKEPTTKNEATGLYKEPENEGLTKSTIKPQQPVSTTVTDKTPPLNEVELSKNVTSPGPAAAVLASGGYNNSANIKAMVAAAALAAAAAQPMPLVSYDTTQNIPAVKAESKEAVVPQPVKEEQETEDEMKETDSIEEKKVAATPKEEPKTDNVPKQEQDKEQDQDEKEMPITESNESDTNVKTESKDDKNTPVPYAVDPDAGIIGCICTFDHDDGFTIQCDRCFRWQHAVCMGIDNIDDAPDNYLCYLCDKSLNIDGERAKRLQQIRLQPKKRKASGHNPPKDSDSLDSTTNDTSAQLKDRKSDPSKRSDEDENANNSNNANKPNGNSVSLPSSSRSKQLKKKGKKENEGEEEESPVLEKHQTLYFEVDTFEYKNSSIRSLISKLPELIKKVPEVKEISGEKYKKSLLNPKSYNVKALPESTKQKCIGLSKLGLFSTKPITQGSNVVELIGELDLKQNYIDEKWNQYWLFGAPKPNVFFHPRLPIVIDQRGLGNISRFVRKSCTPNCEISTYLVEGKVKFVIQTTKEIKTDTELTLPWEWDADHPIRLIDEGQSSFDSISNQDKSRLIKCVSALFDVCECANSGNECPLTKVKKQSSHLQRSTRKFGNKSDEIQEDEYTSIDARLFRRDTIIKENIKLNMMNEESTSRESSVENGLMSEESKNSENEEQDEEESSTTPEPSELSGIFSNKVQSRPLTPDSSAIISNTTELANGNKRKFIDTLIRVDEEFLPIKYKMIKRMSNEVYQLKIKKEPIKQEESLENLPVPLQIVVKEIKPDISDISPNQITSNSPTSHAIPLMADLKSGASSSGNLDTVKSKGSSSSLNSSAVNLVANPSFSPSSTTTTAIAGSPSLSEEKVEKPKIVKKFSLADYKKKAKEVKN